MPDVSSFLVAKHIKEKFWSENNVREFETANSILEEKIYIIKFLEHLCSQYSDPPFLTIR